MLTDTGYVSDKLRGLLKMQMRIHRKHRDLEMLRSGPHVIILKQCILPTRVIYRVHDGRAAMCEMMVTARNDFIQDT